MNTSTFRQITKIILTAYLLEFKGLSGSSVDGLPRYPDLLTKVTARK